MNDKNAFSKFSDILIDIEYLLSKNEFELYSNETQKDPREFQFKWTPLVFNKSNSISIGKINTDQLDKNISCKLCPKKIAAIRNYAHSGNRSVLILHYTGESRKGQKPFSKLNPNLTLRTREAEDLLERLVQKVFGFSSKEFHFQEYPACTFNHNGSNPEDWTNRMDACDIHVKDTITKYGIKAIILMGTAAVLRLGVEEAKAKTGKIFLFNFSGIELPVIVIRSPEGVFSLEEKRKKFEGNKASDAYKSAKKEEDEVKLGLVAHLNEFKTHIGEL